MTASSRDPSRDKILKLLERYHPREAFKILATNAPSPDHPVRDDREFSQLQTDTRKITISRNSHEADPAWYAKRVRLPSDESEAHRWLDQWERGKPVEMAEVIGVILLAENLRKTKKQTISRVGPIR